MRPEAFSMPSAQHLALPDTVDFWHWRERVLPPREKFGAVVEVLYVVDVLEVHTSTVPYALIYQS